MTEINTPLHDTCDPNHRQRVLALVHVLAEGRTQVADKISSTLTTPCMTSMEEVRAAVGQRVTVYYLGEDPAGNKRRYGRLNGILRQNDSGYSVYFPFRSNANFSGGFGQEVTADNLGEMEISFKYS